ncbi:MAG: diguanylate cyclase, partial [Eubacteriales bacterium]|nr:diguanylate cyclase [Eubacteriales bacterium]
TVWGAVERIHSDLLLKKERELFRATIFSINEGIVVTDKQGRITLMNKKAEDLICWSSAEAEGLPFRDVFLNVDQRTRERLPSPVKCVMKNGQNAESAEDEILIPREGEELIISWRAAGMRDEAGQITGVVISFRDISKEYHQKKEIEGFLNMNLDMLCVTDREGTFLRVNKKFQEILGYSQKKIEGKKWITLVHFEDVKSTNEAINQAINTEDQACFINRCRCKDGIYKYIEWNLEKNGNHLYASARDITEKSIREEELRNMAAFDELTGIYNRHFIDERIDEILERSNSYQEPISMVLFDLDNFKKVNDTFGHPVGDKVLKELADIVSGILRKTDFFVRFGGEEFVILMPGTTAKGAMTVSEKIRFTLEHNRNPIVGSYTASFGVSERKIGEPFDAWYQHADEALYFAKKTGKNRVVNAETLKEIGIPLSLLEWNADWESGNEAIDKDHKEMIDYANTFINSVLSKETLQITLRECDVLLEHLARHFEREEAFLEEIKFPAAEKHKSLHESLLRTAFGIKHAYLKGAVDASALFTFVLEDLIRDHLSKEDVLYYSYIKEGEKRKK